MSRSVLLGSAFWMHQALCIFSSTISISSFLGIRAFWLPLRALLHLDPLELQICILVFATNSLASGVLEFDENINRYRYRYQSVMCCFSMHILNLRWKKQGVIRIAPSSKEQSHNKWLLIASTWPVPRGSSVTWYRNVSSSSVLLYS